MVVSIKINVRSQVNGSSQIKWFTRFTSSNSEYNKKGTKIWVLVAVDNMIEKEARKTLVNGINFLLQITPRMIEEDYDL
ncbi:unnamed protein product [Paramecium sonneborni]|uniref:Uncharacterized protein n=1 Tax=Paramecium sonneborni TaxID=65129 RepID=A0A8S1R0Q4_9CILI|nr:unnamed protein product [Paramecium sonneborni]